MNTSSIFKLTKSLDRAYLAYCEPILKEFSLPQISFDIIMYLANNPDRYTARDISDGRNLKPNLVSNYVEKLVESGLIERAPIKGDRRKVRLICTPLAVEIIEKGRIMQKSYINDLTAGVPHEDMEIFHRCIGLLADNAMAMGKDFKTNGGNKDWQSF